MADLRGKSGYHTIQKTIVWVKYKTYVSLLLCTHSLRLPTQMGIKSFEMSTNRRENGPEVDSIR